VEDLDEVQGLAAAAILHHEARRGVLPHRADKAGGEQRLSLHLASRCTTEVANPCFGV
jgi:hypothetical protein